MNRVRVVGSLVVAVLALVLASCGSSTDGTATAPLATVDTNPPSVIRTTARTTTSAAPTPTTTAPPSTTTATTTTSVPTADPSRYEGDAGFYYFTTPTGKFECGIFVTESSVAGCHGDFPSTAPKVEGSGAPNSTVAPNTIELTVGSKARFLSSGDPRFHRFDGPALALPYDEVLAIPGSGSSNGVSCRVEEKTGVTCLDQVGHGFTVSDSAFEVK